MSEDVQRLHWRMKVPDDAASYGVCGDAKTEVSLSWRHEGKERWNEGKNLINLVVTKNFRLVLILICIIKLLGLIYKKGAYEFLLSLASCIKSNAMLLSNNSLI